MKNFKYHNKKVSRTKFFLALTFLFCFLLYFSLFHGMSPIEASDKPDTAPKQTPQSEPSSHKTSSPSSTAAANSQQTPPVQPAAASKTIHVSSLSFWDVQTKSILFQTPESYLIGDAIVQAIVNRMNNQDSTIKLNEKSHTIENIDKNVERLLGVFFDVAKSPSDKHSEIVSQFLKPNGVDIVIFGQYLDKGDTIHIKPAIIPREKQKIITRSFIFEKEKYICTDQLGKKVLCDASDKIANAIEELTTELAQGKQVSTPPPPAQVHIGILPFINEDTKQAVKPEDDSLINKVLIQAVFQAAKVESVLKINQPDHMVKDKEIALKRVSNTLYDPTLSLFDKIDNLDDEIMSPNGIGIILSGLYSLNGDTVTLKPFVIVKHKRKINGRLINLKKKEFIIRMAGTPFLDKSAHERLSLAVQELLVNAL